MEKSCAIWEEDEQHARRLKKAMDEKKGLMLKTMLFTKEEALTKYLEENGLDVLVIGEEVLKYKTKFDNVKTVIVLTEEQETKVCDDYRVIYRYQSSDAIIQQILKEGQALRINAEGKAQYLAVYSPVHCSGCTSLALALANEYKNRNERVLYINLENFSGLSEIFPNQSNMDLSDVIYDFRNSNSLFAEKIDNVICRTNGINYIPGAICVEDLNLLKVEEWVQLITTIGDVGKNDVIILDIGHMIRLPWELMMICDRIFTPMKEKSDYVSEQKMHDFEKYILQMGKENVLDKMERVRVQDIGISKDFFEKVTYCRLGQIAKRIVG